MTPGELFVINNNELFGKNREYSTTMVSVWCLYHALSFLLSKSLEFVAGHGFLTEYEELYLTTKAIDSTSLYLLKDIQNKL